ncbi:MAG: hypothetical protein FWC15_06580 [Fibromonadales bacterium]|nr:hypothetical protein [Fibromonadales bacterium]
MRFFPDNVGFWRKWSVYCIMFIGGCLLATNIFKADPNVVSDAESLMWIGGGALLLGIVMQVLQNRKK